MSSSSRLFTIRDKSPKDIPSYEANLEKLHLSKPRAKLSTEKFEKMSRSKPTVSKPFLQLHSKQANVGSLDDIKEISKRNRRSRKEGANLLNTKGKKNEEHFFSALDREMKRFRKKLEKSRLVLQDSLYERFYLGIIAIARSSSRNASVLYNLWCKNINEFHEHLRKTLASSYERKEILSYAMSVFFFIMKRNLPRTKTLQR